MNEIVCNININKKTFGGIFFYDEIAIFKGWRVQQNKLLKFVRILTPENYCQIWGSKEEIVEICRDYLMKKCFQ